jgi:short-subunit dehydrogenase
MMHSLKEQYGPWAIVTGASAGIGVEFARQLAAEGLNLVLVARRTTMLEAHAKQLQEEFGIETRSVSLDLCDPHFLPSLLDETDDLEIGLLVNNAGTGALGEFLQNDLQDEIRTVELNTIAPLALSHTFGKKMAQRGRGGIIIVSSMVALTGVPRFANYAATKAYDLVLAEGLRYEFKQHGIDVLGLLPGFTHSETMSKMDTSRLPMPIASTSKVVSKALRSLGRRALVVPGFVPKMMGVMMNLMPRGVNTAMMGMTMARIEWKDEN